MRIAITGATGFVGKYAVDYLQGKGYKVMALGRNIDKLNNVFNSSVQKFETNYSYEDLLTKLNGIEAIVHLAAKRLQKGKDPLDLTPYIEDNIMVTQNLIRVAQSNNINKFCFASTIGVYSQNNILPFSEELASYPISIYGVSKLACESLANLAKQRSKLKATNLRFSSLYGVGEKEGVIFTDYVNKARAKETIEVWGKGETSIDLLYIKDAIRAIEKAIDSDSIPGTYNIGSGLSYSVKDLAMEINAVFENNGNLTFLENKPEGGYKVFMNINKAKSKLNWSPSWSLKDSLLDMKALYDSNL